MMLVIFCFFFFRLAPAPAGDLVLELGCLILHRLLRAGDASAQRGLHRGRAPGEFLGAGHRGEQAAATALGVLGQPSGGVEHLVRRRRHSPIGHRADQALHRLLQWGFRRHCLVPRHALTYFFRRILDICGHRRSLPSTSYGRRF